jgi:hypothetical protein
MKNPLPSSWRLLRQFIASCLLLTSLSSFAQNPPAAPSDFTATPNGMTYQITLNWVDNSNDETEFLIVREDPDICCQFYSISANSTSFVDMNVLPNAQYSYTLSAVNENGRSDEVYASATIEKTAPPAPTNVIASTGPLTTIKITFTDNSDLESYYEIQHSSGVYGSTSVTGGETGSTVTTYINNEPSSQSPTHIHYPPNSTVYIQVRAVINDNGHLIYGPLSSVVSAVTRDYPAAPSNLMLTEEGGHVKFSWTDNSDNEAAFFIWRFEDNGSPIDFVADSNATSIVDPTAELNTQYTYWIQALDAYEVTIPYEYWIFTGGRYVEFTGSASGTLIAPTNVTAMGTSPVHFRVTFTDTNEFEQAYDVHFTSSDIPSYTEIWTVDGIEGSGETIETEPSFDFGQSPVYIKVRAVTFDPITGASNFGPFSETVTATALESFPIPPSDFTAVPEGPYIRLNWTDNSNPGDEFDEAYFIIMRADDFPGNFNTLFTLPANANTFLDTTVLPGHTYAYRLEAMNEFDQGNEVIDASATAAEITLTPPLATFATFVAPTSFRANWRSVEGADYYKLYVYTAHDSSVVSAYNGLIVYDTMAPVSGLRAYRKYFYQVSAGNESTESELSNVIGVAPVKDLILRAVCSAEPTTFRRWKIINNNPFAVPVTWYVLATGETGTTTALPGESYFETQTASGSYNSQINFTRITWLNDKLVERSIVKSSIKTQCTETFALGTVEESVGKNSFVMDVYPNPTATTFTIHIATPYDEDVNVEIINLQGQRMLTEIISPKNDVEVNAYDYPAGLYIVNVTQGSLQKRIKLVKE